MRDSVYISCCFKNRWFIFIFWINEHTFYFSLLIFCLCIRTIYFRISILYLNDGSSGPSRIQKLYRSKLRLIIESLTMVGTTELKNKSLPLKWKVQACQAYTILRIFLIIDSKQMRESHKLTFIYYLHCSFGINTFFLFFQIRIMRS